MWTYTKARDGAVIVERDGKHVYTIRRNKKKGYDKYLIMPDGTEVLPPLFSWFLTLKSVKHYCEA